MFQGAQEKRCRQGERPVGNVWLLNETESSLCGEWKCEKGSYCGAPYEYDIPFDENELKEEKFLFGYIRFDNVFFSMLTTLHFADVTGWSAITYMVGVMSYETDDIIKPKRYF